MHTFRYPQVDCHTKFAPHLHIQIHTETRRPLTFRVPCYYTTVWHRLLTVRQQTHLLNGGSFDHRKIYRDLLRVALAVCWIGSRLSEWGQCSRRALGIQTRQSMTWTIAKQTSSWATAYRICSLLYTEATPGALRGSLSCRNRLMVLWGEWGGRNATVANDGQKMDVQGLLVNTQYPWEGPQRRRCSVV